MNQLERLLADARVGVLAGESSAFHEARFDSAQDRETATGLLAASPGPTALLLLLALRREAPEAYAAVPASARAETLASALREYAVLNDFGYLDEDGNSFDREAARALLELGTDAVPALRPLLDDLQPGPLAGSEESTIAYVLGLRRADFAYNYLARILGCRPEFDPDPVIRDDHLTAMRSHLDAERR
ncbi:hypothetical protein ACQPZQ_38630 [Pseudonocardia sp. CA-142604]|uniref:hypothetical protein n=1 Tax=Pseudonocardia sp. CA-142604 TaxID=3240024 RepID=UPI003D8D3B2C